MRVEWELGGTYNRENDPVVIVEEFAVDCGSDEEPQPHEDQRKACERPAEDNDQGAFVVCHFDAYLDVNRKGIWDSKRQTASSGQRRLFD